MHAHYLRWKGQVTGPYELSEIHALLASGEVSRMHQIEHAGQWRPLDEFLREQEAAARYQIVTVREPGDEQPHATEEAPLEEHGGEAAPDEHSAPIRAELEIAPANVAPAGPRTSSLAIAAFATSFLCFVPIVNFVSWIPSLVLAFTALAEMDRDPNLGGRGLARGAIAICCAFLALGVIFVLLLALGLLHW